jgi:hypothetical protein
MSKWIVRSGILLMVSALVQTQTPPAGWILAGGNPKNYDTGVDPLNAYDGQQSAYLKSTGAGREAKQEFGTLMQDFNARQYVGQRIRFSAFVKSDNVQDWAGLWMRVDKKDKPGVSFDNMQHRPIKGTTAWQHYDVVLDVPEDSTLIAFGILLSKAGEVWMSGVKFEVVGTSVPVTSMIPPQATAPANLGFDK